MGYATPVLSGNYEIQIGKNLTVAPSISIYKYDGDSFWGSETNEFRNYNYTETVIPIGLKVSFYFDELLKLNQNWDVYSAGSLGATVRQFNWEINYGGKKNIVQSTGPVYIDFHIGAEYHLNKTIGIQLDVSAGISAIGIAIHI